MIKRCAHCHRHGGRVRSAKLCTDCRSAGWRWCSIGKHTTQARDYLPYRNACADCRRVEACRQKRRARGQATPPDGYVRLIDAAPVFGYSRSRLRDLCQLGVVAAWQHRPGAAWYVRREP